MEAELVLINGNFYTQDIKRPQAEAIAIGGGLILAAGTNAQIREMADKETEIIDLQGRLGFPGFTDGHSHFHMWSLTQRGVQLAHTTSLAQALERISAATKKCEPDKWVLGYGMDEKMWPERRFPSRKELDLINPSNPTFLWGRDLHHAVVNSRALELGRLEDAAPDPPGVNLIRDESGRLTGLFKERAIDLISEIVPAPTIEETAEAMSEAINHLHQLGLTCIHDQRLWDLQEGSAAMRAWQKLDQQGNLKIRAWVNITGSRLEHALSLGLTTGFGNSRLRMGHVKFFVDGSVGSQTAWMVEPFEDGTNGGPVCDLKELESAINRAHEGGLAVSVHAIGDRANRELISIFERLKKSPHFKPGRAFHRIEHVQILQPVDLFRLSKLNVVASVQPTIIPDDIDLHDRLVGDRGAWVHPFRSLMETGVTVMFSSDCPVCELNPMLGIQAAVTRQRRDGSPEEGWYSNERITVEQAVYAYTMAPALACGLERDQGSITPGKKADIIALDNDIFEMNPMNINETQVDLTVFDGQVVFRRNL